MTMMAGGGEAAAATMAASSPPSRSPSSPPTPPGMTNRTNRTIISNRQRRRKRRKRRKGTWGYATPPAPAPAPATATAPAPAIATAGAPAAPATAPAPQPSSSSPASRFRADGMASASASAAAAAVNQPRTSGAGSSGMVGGGGPAEAAPTAAAATNMTNSEVSFASPAAAAAAHGGTTSSSMEERSLAKSKSPPAPPVPAARFVDESESENGVRKRSRSTSSNDDDNDGSDASSGDDIQKKKDDAPPASSYLGTGSAEAATADDGGGASCSPAALDLPTRSPPPRDTARGEDAARRPDAARTEDEEKQKSASRSDGGDGNEQEEQTSPPLRADEEEQRQQQQQAATEAVTTTASASGTYCDSNSRKPSPLPPAASKRKVTFSPLPSKSRKRPFRNLRDINYPSSSDSESDYDPVEYAKEVERNRAAKLEREREERKRGEWRRRNHFGRKKGGDNGDDRGEYDSDSDFDPVEVAKEIEERARVEREARERKEKEARERKEEEERLKKEKEAKEEEERKAAAAANAAANGDSSESDSDVSDDPPTPPPRFAAAAAAAASSSSFAAPSSSSAAHSAAAAARARQAASLRAAAAAYAAIPAVQKPPPAAAGAATGGATSASAASVAASYGGQSSSASAWPAAVKSEEADSEPTGRLKDDCDYEPRVKADPEDDNDDNNDYCAFVTTTHEEDRRPISDVDRESYWAAVKIKEEENESWRQEIEERKEKEKDAMGNSIKGKAWLFVERVLERHQELLLSKEDSTGDLTDGQISAVARDDMVFMAERMLELHAEFEADMKPNHVDIAFHYTRPENMDRIRTDGLMTHAERQANSVESNYNGSVFGDGVYTGNNPFAFMNYGGTGLLIARMKGNMEKRSMDLVGMRRRTGSGNVDTVIGNKVLGRSIRRRRRRRPTYGWHNGTWYNGDESEESEDEEDNDDFHDEVVLQKSSQCVPLIRYDSSLINTTPESKDIIHTFHTAFQEIVDEFFNGGEQTEVKEYSLPSTHVHRPAIPMPMPMPPVAMPGGFPGGFPGFPGGMPAGLPGALFGGPGRRLGGLAGIHNTQNFDEVVEFIAPYLLDAPECAYEQVESESIEADAECIICLDQLCSKGSKVAKIKICGHMFHKECIEESLTHKNTCPMCRTTIGEVRGKMPSGTMSINRSRTKCSGYENCRGSILIHYSIPGDTQRHYMVNPGHSFSGKTDCAYLPDNKEGRELLERLKYAFSKGLTFVVGTSMSTGQDNVVTWGSIHHKTSPSGGSHGYPDPSYIDNCNEELDNVGVPDAKECKERNGDGNDDEGEEKKDEAIVVE